MMRAQSAMGRHSDEYIIYTLYYVFYSYDTMVMYEDRTISHGIPQR